MSTVNRPAIITLEDAVFGYRRQTMYPEIKEAAASYTSSICRLEGVERVEVISSGSKLRVHVGTADNAKAVQRSCERRFKAMLGRPMYKSYIK